MSEETGQKRLLTKLFKWLKMVSGIKKKKWGTTIKNELWFQDEVFEEWYPMQN